MIKHTAGPWVIKKSPFEVYNVDHGALTHHIVSGHTMIAALYAHHESHDAHLIAAAPDLLDALMDLADWYREHTGLPPTAANAAIAKATGGEEGERGDD